mmetsp:Transcript_3315/g.6923  ORF Transcript_3315/g.6923 Transcript_3315/m.6923 type:complete len:90 (+) Transcript_3315:462-731(+)
MVKVLKIPELKKAIPLLLLRMNEKMQPQEPRQQCAATRKRPLLRLLPELRPYVLHIQNSSNSLYPDTTASGWPSRFRTPTNQFIFFFSI